MNEYPLDAHDDSFLSSRFKFYSNREIKILGLALSTYLSDENLEKLLLVGMSPARLL